jgi:succinate dehydrogenase / fumarate reductase iron-sulfur subunit
MTGKVALRIWRGDAGQGGLTDYQVEANEGEVLLDVLHRPQATQADDLAVRWNRKAASAVPVPWRSTAGRGWPA